MNQVERDDLLGACELMSKEATRLSRSGEADELYVNGYRYGIRKFKATLKTVQDHPGKLSAEARSDGRASNGRKPVAEKPAKQTAKKTVTKKPRGTTDADQGKPVTPSQKAKVEGGNTLTRGQRAAATRAANRAAREKAAGTPAKKATAKKASAAKRPAGKKTTTTSKPASSKAPPTKAAAVTKAPAVKSNIIPIESVRRSGPPIKAVGR